MKYSVSITASVGKSPHVELGIYTAKDGQEAIKQAKQDHPDYQGSWFATPLFESEKATA